MTDTPVPRVPPLTFEEWDDEARRVLPGFLRRPELYLSGGSDALPMPKALGMFAHHVPLARTWMAFSEVLANEDSTLDARTRELLILRVAWRTRSEYEWLQHIRIGHHAGLSTDELHAVPAGATADSWNPLDRALLAATDQVIDRFGVDEATWRVLADHFEPAQLLEVLFVIGSYTCLAAVFNSVGLAADPPTEPIDAPALPPRDG